MSHHGRTYDLKTMMIVRWSPNATPEVTTTRVGSPISRNSFRTQVWLPAVKASGVDFRVRVHDLRHAHASWPLAGGSDLRSMMDRMGHHQIQTTQKYLHALPEADRKNLDALERTSRRNEQVTRQRTRIEGCQCRPICRLTTVLTRHVDPGQMVRQLLTMAATAAVTSSSRSTSDGRRLMILPVAKRPGPGTDIPLCSVPLSLTWSLTGVSCPHQPRRPRNGAVN